MNAGLQPGAQHLSVTRAYLMKYNSIIHTSLSLNKSPLNTFLNAEACLKYGNNLGFVNAELLQRLQVTR